MVLPRRHHKFFQCGLLRPRPFPTCGTRQRHLRRWACGSGKNDGRLACPPAAPAKPWSAADGNSYRALTGASTEVEDGGWHGTVKRREKLMAVTFSPLRLSASSASLRLLEGGQAVHFTGARSLPMARSK